jgi:hypothetical protein
MSKLLKGQLAEVHFAFGIPYSLGKVSLLQCSFSAPEQIQAMIL